MLLGGVDLSMSAAVQPVATLPTLPSSGPPPPHNPLHHTAGGLALPALGSAPVMMPRPPTTAMPPLGPSLPPSHQDAADLAEAAPNQDVLLALLARNKNLEGKDSFLSPPSSPDRALRLLLSSRGMPIDPRRFDRAIVAVDGAGIPCFRYPTRAAVMPTSPVRSRSLEGICRRSSILQRPLEIRTTIRKRGCEMSYNRCNLWIPLSVGTNLAREIT